MHFILQLLRLKFHPQSLVGPLVFKLNKNCAKTTKLIDEKVVSN